MNRGIVKVCGLRDECGAVAALGVDYLGLNFVPRSKRFVGQEFSLPSQPDLMGRMVGVFADSSVGEVVSQCGGGALAAVQLHGNETPAYCTELRGALSGTAIWKAFPVEESFEFARTEEFAPSCEVFLFDRAGDGEFGGSGRSFDWRLLDRYRGPRPFLLAGGIGIEEVRSLCERPIGNPWFIGIDVNSRVEGKNGRKSLAAVAALLEVWRS